MRDTEVAGPCCLHTRCGLWAGWATFRHIAAPDLTCSATACMLGLDRWNETHTQMAASAGGKVHSLPNAREKRQQTRCALFRGCDQTMASLARGIDAPRRRADVSASILRSSSAHTLRPESLTMSRLIHTKLSSNAGGPSR